MQKELTNKDLLHFLKSKHLNAGFVDRLKIHYRPLVCPYVSLINMVKTGDKVGDIGCGSGQFFFLLSAFARPAALYGIEISDKLIRNANNLLADSKISQIRFDKYDGIHFPEHLLQMDIIFLIDVLHHVPKPNQQQFLISLATRIKRGAKLVIKDINAANMLVYFNKMHDLIFAGEIGNELPAEHVQDVLKSNGLEIADLKKRIMYVYPHYTIVATKP
ncbi:MAG: methyltransferase domain-containing protein [Chitinophagaceae bacterium]